MQKCGKVLIPHKAKPETVSGKPNVNLQMKESNELIVDIKAKKRFLTIAFILLWNCILLIKLSERQKIQQLDWLFIIAGLGLSLRALWQLFGHVTIIIDSESMKVSKAIGGLTFKRTDFQIQEISNVRILKNQDEDTAWDLGGILLYDKTLTVIQFDYKGKQLTIGKSLNDFSADSIIKFIHRMTSGKSKR